ncbi:MAG: energy-coupling factor ABC transporter permease [Bifidobacteriaceae bacterium]|jgi:cobalt/nickel transport system permease protein|nr:energy-coupling factor ABC transporter permease [Bifidobacteriaceae bacterium]
MHVPDHFLNDPTSIATAVVASAGVVTAALATRRTAPWPRFGSLARTDPAPRSRASALIGAGGLGVVRPGPVALAATTALVFGLQMVNYPVAAGTSGHLLGGALAAALLGPAWGVLSLTAVLTVQAVLFADGGLTALGTNVLLMALLGTAIGWLIQSGLVRRLTRPPNRADLAHNGTHPLPHDAAPNLSRTGATPRRHATNPLLPDAAPTHSRWGFAVGAAGVGGFASVVVAAAAFAVLFGIGGNAEVGFGALAGHMIGVHCLVGLGEGLITALVVAVVAAVAPGWCAIDPREAPVGEYRTLQWRASGLVGGLAVVSAAVLAPFASAAPDGLEATAEAVGFAGAARDHALAGFPLADYGEATGMSVQVVGLIGLAVCVGVALALGKVLQLRRHLAPSPA